MIGRVRRGSSYNVGGVDGFGKMGGVRENELSMESGWRFWM